MKDVSRTKRKRFLHSKWLCLSFIPEEKIKLEKYIKVMQMIETCNECDAGLNDINNLFFMITSSLKTLYLI